MKLVFEKGAEGRHLSVLPNCDVPAFTPEGSMLRSSKPRLPHMSETESAAITPRWPAAPTGQRRVLPPWLLHHEIQPQGQRGSRRPAWL